MLVKNHSQLEQQDKVWQEFLDVLTGKKASTEAPTLEELNMERDEEC